MGGAGGRFSTTRWTLVLASAQNANNTAALEELCRIYWRPVFAFVRGRGHSVADAQDLTQDFFVGLLGGNFLRQADRTRGRFRSFLLVSLNHFLADARDRAGPRNGAAGSRLSRGTTTRRKSAVMRVTAQR